MAAPATKNSAPRASSILSQEVTADSGTKPVPAGAPLSVITKTWVTLRRVFFTASDVADAAKLYDVMNKMQESVLSVLGVVSTNQLIPGNILRSVTFTAGQTQALAHGLGRKWQGYFCVHATASSGYPLFTDGAYPAGVGADSVVPLFSGNSGTYDIYIF
jgi:hypothetical protein